LYESFFGIAGPAPVTYIREGIAGGLVAGGALGIVVGMFSTLVTSLLVWAGLGLLVARYMDSLHEFVAALRGIGAVRRGSAYKRLLARVRGDKALAKRLVEYEARRTPEAGREELAERALDRLERDSR
ncbi:MAG TPA: hypothetical protein PLB78_15170, partial [Anaerolineae bacterium]|nr:hypothetical protein [Anaerolineae bacterium]